MSSSVKDTTDIQEAQSSSPSNIRQRSWSNTMNENTQNTQVLNQQSSHQSSTASIDDHVDIQFPLCFKLSFASSSQTQPFGFVILSEQQYNTFTLTDLRTSIKEEFKNDRISTVYPCLETGNFTFLMNQQMKISQKQEMVLKVSTFGQQITLTDHSYLPPASSLDYPSFPPLLSSSPLIQSRSAVVSSRPNADRLASMLDSPLLSDNRTTIHAFGLHQDSSAMLTLEPNEVLEQFDSPHNDQQQQSQQHSHTHTHTHGNTQLIAAPLIRKPTGRSINLADLGSIEDASSSVDHGESSLPPALEPQTPSLLNANNDLNVIDNNVVIPILKTNVSLASTDSKDSGKLPIVVEEDATLNEQQQTPSNDPDNINTPVPPFESNDNTDHLNPLFPNIEATNSPSSQCSQSPSSTCDSKPLPPMWHRGSPCPGNAIIRVYGLYEEVVVLQGVEQLFDLYLNLKPHGSDSASTVWIDVELSDGLKTEHYDRKQHGENCRNKYIAQQQMSTGETHPFVFKKAGLGCVCAGLCSFCNLAEKHQTLDLKSPINTQHVCVKHDVFGVLCSMFCLHPVTIEDILSSDDREKMEVFPDYLFVVLNMILDNNKNKNIEVDIDDSDDDTYSSDEDLNQTNNKFASPFLPTNRKKGQNIHSLSRCFVPDCEGESVHPGMAHYYSRNGVGKTTTNSKMNVEQCYRIGDDYGSVFSEYQHKHKHHHHHHHHHKAAVTNNTTATSRPTSPCITSGVNLHNIHLDINHEQLMASTSNSPDARVVSSLSHSTSSLPLLFAADAPSHNTHAKLEGAALEHALERLRNGSNPSAQNALDILRSIEEPTSPPLADSDYRPVRSHVPHSQSAYNADDHTHREHARDINMNVLPSSANADEFKLADKLFMSTEHEPSRLTRRARTYEPSITNYTTQSCTSATFDSEEEDNRQVRQRVMNMRAKSTIHDCNLKMLVFHNLVLTFHNSTLNHAMESILDSLHQTISTQVELEKTDQTDNSPQWRELAASLGFTTNTDCGTTEGSSSTRNTTQELTSKLSYRPSAPPMTPLVMLKDSTRKLVTTARIIHSSLDWIVDSFLPVVHEICTEIDVLEDLSHVLSINEHNDLLLRITSVRRRLAWMRQRLWSKKDILVAMLGRDWREYLSNLDMPYLRDVLDHNTRMTQKLTVAVELLDSLQENYLARVNIEVALGGEKMNHIMQSLTSVATIFMPLSLIPGLMGMNCFVPFQAGEPLTGVDYLVEQIPFIVIVLLMTALALIGMAVFKRKGLL